MTGELRVPPHSLQAEQGLIGGLLCDNSVLDKLPPMADGDFYTWEHKAIWGAASALVTAGRPADVLTVAEVLRQRGQAIGGSVDEPADSAEAAGQTRAYLQALLESVPNAAHATEYARLVLESSRRRRVIAAAEALSAQAWGKGQVDTDAMIDRAVTELLRLQDGQGGYEPQDLQPLSLAFIDALERRASGETDAMPTGLRALDRLTAEGGRRGEVWVVGARPSNGKTAFSLSLCRSVARRNRVLMLTQEDSLQMLTARHVAAAGGVNLADIRNPKHAPDAMWSGVTEGIELLQPLQVSMCDQPSLTLGDVRRHVQHVKRKHRDCAMVVIDYLQLMTGEGDNRNQSLGALANGLKQLAKELNTWVVLLSQLNREADKRTGPPQMGDLRDSGDIEGAADLIMLLRRPYLLSRKEADKPLLEAHVCKHKNGATDSLKFCFDGARQRISDWADEEGAY
jgi:replicative DNA helicase